MNLGPVVSLILILCGNAMSSLGMVLQKRSVTGLKTAEKKSRLRRKMKALWVLGLVMISLLALVQLAAIGGLGAQRMGAATGANVVFMLILSALFLKERITVSASVWALVMAGAIAAINFIPQAGGTGFSLPFMIAAFLAPLMFLAPIPFLAKTARRTPIAALYGAASGAFSGFMVIAMRLINSLLAGSSEYGLQGLFGSWIFWAVLFGLSGWISMLLIQFAYANGPMQASAPYFYGLAVLWPICWSYGVFAIPVAPIPALLYAVIALAAVMIQRSSTRGKAGAKERAQ